jgi:uncharacterized membrane protein
MFSEANSINDAGQVVGYSIAGNVQYATEWTGSVGGSIINLGGLPGFTQSVAYGINDAGQAVGFSYTNIVPPPPFPVPESSTWAMMLVGFAVLGYAGYRRSERVLGQNARLSIYQPDV